jgi:FkbM family methyltransferase
MGLRTALAHALAFIFRLLSSVLGDNFALTFLNTASKRAFIQYVQINDCPLKLYSPNQITFWRAQTFASKEPETIEWINSFGPNEIMWDIGANVGLYSLYAAVARNAQVLAFEPSAMNHFVLCKNIEINGLDQLISPLCLAFSNTVILDHLNMPTTELGGALAGFATTKDYQGNEMIPVFRQASLGYTIDAFIAEFNPPLPHHLKIDVDGLESAIIKGAGTLLANPKLRTLSIELEDDKSEERDFVINRLAEHGLKVRHKKHAPMFDNSPYANIYNFLFARD